MHRVDIHSHILSGVDDGAASIEETLAMLQGAKQAGFEAVIATPHLKRIDADINRIREAYQSAKPLFAAQGLDLYLGFECHYRLLLDWQPAALRPFCLGGGNVLLLEFPWNGLPLQWERSINELQKVGLEIVIAHPERYAPVQADQSIAVRMVQIGCELQLSAGSLTGGLFSKERACALGLLKAGLIHYLASDAHGAADYPAYAWVNTKYGHLISGGALLNTFGDQV